jgi:hypothetical protein
MVSPVHGDYRRCQAEIPLIVLCRFPGPALIFVGGYGGVYATKNPGSGEFAFWQKYGTNLPNAVVTDIHYSAEADVLVAGTLGRGAWSLRDVSSTVVDAPTLTIRGSSASCVGGWIEQSIVTFSAQIQGAQELTPPPSFVWNVQGAANTAQSAPWQISVTMPNAGLEVAITLVVTDATGFQLFAHLVDYTVSPQVAQLRGAFCELLNRLKTIATVNWPIDPLSPPILPSDVVGQLRDIYAEVHTTAKEMSEVSVRLLDSDKGTVIKAKRLPSRDGAGTRFVDRSEGAAPYIIPLRTEGKGTELQRTTRYRSSPGDIV